jgi:hypothetical protein
MIGELNHAFLVLRRRRDNDAALVVVGVGRQLRE